MCNDSNKILDKLFGRNVPENCDTTFFDIANDRIQSAFKAAEDKIESIKFLTFLDYLNDVEKRLFDSLNSEIERHVINGATEQQMSPLRQHLKAFTNDMYIKYSSKPIAEISLKSD